MLILESIYRFNQHIKSLIKNSLSIGFKDLSYKIIEKCHLHVFHPTFYDN